MIEGHVPASDPEAVEGTAQYPWSCCTRDANGFSWYGSDGVEAEPFEVLPLPMTEQPLSSLATEA